MKYPDAASPYAGPPDYNTPYELWTLEDLGNGKWAFRGSNGKLLARCYQCATSSVDNLAFVYVDSATDHPEAQWTV